MRLLLVVDYQNDFVSGALGFEKARALEAEIAEKIRTYRASGDAVAFTFDCHDADYLDTQEGRNLPIAHCIKGTDGIDLYGEIKALQRAEDRCFYKSCFGSAELFDFLRNSAYTEIELCGVVSNICVLSNAVLAKTALPEVKIIVDARCTASNDDRLNDAALAVLAGLQVEIQGE